MDEYNVQVKIRNGKLLRKMKEKNIESVAGLVSLLEEKYGQKGGLLTEIYYLVSLKKSPLDRHGMYTKTCIMLCDFFQCAPDDIFTSDQLEGIVHEKNSFEMDVDASRIHSLQNQNPEHFIEKKEIHKLLNTLTEREQKVVCLHFGLNGDVPLNLYQLAPIFDVSVERVRQILGKALRKLGNPYNLKRIGYEGRDKRILDRSFTEQERKNYGLEQ